MVGLRPSSGFCRVLSSVGRIRTYRLAGSKLIFFDIVQDGHKIQIMCNQRRLGEVTPGEFKAFYRLLRRGDAFCMYDSAVMGALLNGYSHKRETAPYHEGGAYCAGGGAADDALPLSA